jgi:hypothetical protein
VVRVPHAAPWALAAAGATVALVQTARLRWRAFVLRRRAARARDGEARARDLLARRGYDVIAEQPSAEWSVRLGGEQQTFVVRADYLVARGGRVFVAEVKTGAAAPALATRATRRQLLEYACAFAADGVLLVDADEGRVDAVGFELPRPRPRPRAAAFALGLVVGAALALAAVLAR